MSTLAPFQPKVTAAQADRLITGPGSPLETGTVQLPYRGAPCPPLKTYKNLPPTTRAIFFAAVEQFKDRDYIKLYSGIPRDFDGEYARGSLQSITYAQAKAEVVKLMWALKTRYGIEKGDKVAVAAKNSPEWCLWFWAVTSLGGVLVGANAWLLGKELEYCLDLADTKVLLVDPERLARLQENNHLDNLFAKKLKTVVNIGSVPSNNKYGSKVVSYSSLLSGTSPVDPPAVDIHPDDDNIVLFTSGTSPYSPAC